MIYTIDMMSHEQCDAILEYYNFCQFSDGSKTGSCDKKIKYNLEIDDPRHYPQLNQYFDSCVKSCLEFSYLFVPRSTTYPLFLQYNTDMHYEYHHDFYMMGSVRTDYSVTCFFNSPDEYEGGELIIDVGNKLLEYKLDKGKALVYPTGLKHKIAPVKSGSRKVAVFWIESVIHDSRIRNILAEFSNELYNKRKLLGDSIYDFERIRYQMIREYGNI